MTFIEFKKNLIELELSIPKFSKLIKISEKNIQAYKKKEGVPNPIAVIVTLLVQMKQNNIDYTACIGSLALEYKKKEGAGFAKQKRDKPKDDK